MKTLTENDLVKHKEILIFNKTSIEDLFFISIVLGKEKVEGEELQQWLRMVVAPKELTIFVRGKQESLLPVQSVNSAPAS